MAGVPSPVVARAREVVETTTGDSRDDADDADDGGDASEPATNGASARDSDAESNEIASDAVADALDEQGLDAESIATVATELRELDIATMTPLEALNTLDELRSTLEASRSR